MTQLILASGSPRRKELLEQMGLEFSICPAKGEEIITEKEPAAAVEGLALQKALEVAGGILDYNERHSDLVTPGDSLVIGADTVVVCDGRIMGKPADEEEAFHMLTLLSGRTHQVFTGLALVFLDPAGRCGQHTVHEMTEVEFYPMTEQEIRDYIATGEPMDKAGAYGIQGKCAPFIKGIRGDYYNVVGLPCARLYQELKKLGFPIRVC